VKPITDLKARSLINMNFYTLIRGCILCIFLLLLNAIGQAQEVPSQPWCPVTTDKVASEKFSVVYKAKKTIFAAGSLGWVDAIHVNYPEDLQTTRFRHRWAGVTAAVIAAAAAIMQQFAQFGGKRRDITYGILLRLACALVAVTGHLGATLIYGVDYF